MYLRRNEDTVMQSSLFTNFIILLLKKGQQDVFLLIFNGVPKVVKKFLIEYF